MLCAVALPTMGGWGDLAGDAAVKDEVANTIVLAFLSSTALLAGCDLMRCRFRLMSARKTQE